MTATTTPDTNTATLRKGRTCVLCHTPISLLTSRSAHPLERGRCCRFCHDTMVVPARALLRVVPDPIQRIDLLRRMQERNEAKAQRGLEARRLY